MAHQLYRHFDSAGALLYVGIALCSIQRLGQHKLGAAWFQRIATVRIEHYPDVRSALRAEVKAIREERPIFNRRDSVGYRRPRVIKRPLAVLADYLDRHDITQQELAGRLGCSQSLVSQWISGDTEITVEWLIPIEEATERE